MIYPRDIADRVRGDESLHERFPHVRPGGPFHTVDRQDSDPGHEVERWMLGEGRKTSPEVRRYLHYLGSMLSVFKAIELNFPRTPRKSEAESDGVGTSVGEMMVLARYLYYLDSHAVEGDVLECGCFKGFSSCCLSWACAYLGRRLIVADSFEGLPEDSSQSFYNEGEFTGAFDEVEGNLSCFGRPEAVDFIRGFYSKSLPGFNRPLSMIWMDVDLYSSTRDVLSHVFDSLSPDGVVFSHELMEHRDFSDDRLVPTVGPAKALHDFHEERSTSHSAAFCTGCLGIVVPGGKGRVAFSRQKQELTTGALAREISDGLAGRIDEGISGLLRRTYHGLKKIPVLEPLVTRSRGLLKSTTGR